MSLIAMAVYCTEENKKDKCFRESISSVYNTVNFNRHRLFLCINAATEEAERTIAYLRDDMNAIRHGHALSIIWCPGNLGTAKAINLAWKFRLPGENCIKMDDDILIHTKDWADHLERAIAADPNIGQIGLKRRDCWEWPGYPHPDWRSTLHMLPHIPGERWQIVEKVKHVIGSCVMHSSALLDKVGFLYQPGVYSYDDVIMSHRSEIAGFYNCFLPHIDIEHIDDGKTAYQSWKEKYAGEFTKEVIKLVHEMRSGTKSIYYAADY